MKTKDKCIKQTFDKTYRFDCYGKIKIISMLLILAIFNSCQQDKQVGMLECLLENIESIEDEVDIDVGQHNGWNDSMSLIIITYHEKSMNIPMNNELKGRYKGQDIYFYQGDINSLDKKEYKQIPNNIVWNNNSIKIDNEIFAPPYDPISIQIEYHTRRKCFGSAIKGKEYLKSNFGLNCACK